MIGWLKRLAPLYARLALGTAFLSAVASRFGIWAGTPGLTAFEKFTTGYGAQTLSFVPPAAVPPLIWCATVAELTLGIALIAGFKLRWVALASAVLLAMFATSMAISFGQNRRSSTRCIPPRRRRCCSRHKPGRRLVGVVVSG